MKWYLLALRRYADFNGRSSRREYFWFWTINLVVLVFLATVDWMLGIRLPKLPIGFLGASYFLATLVPGLAVYTRRLHDSGHGHFSWIGNMAVLLEGDDYENDYGPPPTEPKGLL